MNKTTAVGKERSSFRKIQKGLPYIHLKKRSHKKKKKMEGFCDSKGKNLPDYYVEKCPLAEDGAARSPTKRRRRGKRP